MGADTLDGKRVYGDRRGRTTAYVASGLGVARVELSGDRIGRFSLVARCSGTAIAGDDGTLVVGTDGDVLVGDGREFAPTGFGEAVAVSLADGMPVAAAPDGTVARLRGDDWEPVGSVTGPRRADRGLLAAADGVYHVDEEVTALGDGAPGDVRDVAAGGPFAATGDGLYRYDGRGWRLEVEADCALVAAAGERACAVAAGGLHRHRDGEWHAGSRPTGAPLAGLAYGESLYAVTADGTVAVRASPADTPDGQGGWRSRALGVCAVAGLAVP